MSAHPRPYGLNPENESEHVRRRNSADTQHEPVVRFEQVGKTFGKQEVLHGITFPVPWGQIIGVIGPSGSGKTTTIRLMLGTLKSSHGTVRLFGRDPWHLRRAARERIGYMPQGFVLYPT